jgi:hypothetical protein
LEAFDQCLRTGYSNDDCLSRHTVGTRCESIKDNASFNRLPTYPYTSYPEIFFEIKNNTASGSPAKCDWTLDRPAIVVQTEILLPRGDRDKRAGEYYYVYRSSERIPPDSKSHIIRIQRVDALPWSPETERAMTTIFSDSRYRVVFESKSK